MMRFGRNSALANFFPPANQDWLEKADDISAGPDHPAYDYDKKNNKVSSFRSD